MKKIISILLVAMLALSSAIAVNAEGIKDVFGNGVKDLEARGATLVESGDYNDTGVIWEYYDDGSFIVKKGPDATSGTTSGDKATWRKYMGNITSLVFEDGITDIAAQAFGGCSNIETLTIADTVTTVGSGAFGGCTGLVSVDMGNGVTTLPDSLFGGCQKLVSFVIGDGLTALPNAMFGGCTSLKTVTLGNNIKTIGDNNFGGCSSLESFVIPDSVTSIGTNNFSGCNSLTSLTIGSGLQSIGDKLAGGAELTSITISPQNTSFVLEDNLLLTADGKELIKATVQSTGTIPDTLETIRGYAFEYCSNITSVVIPGNVTTIGEGAFYGCDNLTSVEIPSSVTSIAGNAFLDCSSDLVISGEPGSYAQSFCSSKGITFESSTSEVKASGDYNGNLRWTLYEDGTFVLSGKGSSSGDLGNWRDYMYDITSVVYLEGITDVADYAFDGCSNIKTLTIPKTATSISFNSFNNCNGLENLNINCNLPGTAYFCNRNSLKSVTFGEGVTTIPDYCFQNCSNLTLVTFPSTLTSIGSYVFYGCSNLSTATLPSKLTSIGQYAFNGCRSLESVAIPSGVTSINDGTFGSCINLTSLTIPEGVTSIGYGAFSTCPNLPSLTIPASVTNLNSGAFSSCYGLEELTIDCEMTNTGYFNGLSALKSLTFGPAVTKIPDYSFQSCSSLASVTIPATVTSIGRSDFYGCSNLTSATIPASVTSIGNDAFKNCSADLVVSGEFGSKAYTYCIANDIKFESQDDFIASGITSDGATIWGITTDGVLHIYGDGPMTEGEQYDSSPWYEYRENITSAVIHDGVTTIGDNAFYWHRALTSVDIPDSVTSIGARAFAGCEILSSIDIPDGVTTIEESAFANCMALTSVDIPDGVTTISNSVFNDCRALNTVNIPDSVTTIDNHAFNRCRALTSVEIPASVTTIGDFAFQDCMQLNSIYIYGENTSLGENKNTIPADTIVIAPKPSKAYDYCRETNTLSRFMEFGATYDVTLNLNGGTLPAGTSTTITKTVGTPIASLPTPTRDNDEFLGWSTNNTLGGYFYPNVLNFDGADTLYAIWADDVAFDEAFKDSSFYYEGDNNVVEGYEDTKVGKLNGEYSNTWIKQSAKWTDRSKNEAELRVDYSYALYEPKDVVFVLDVSGSMEGSKFTTMIDIVEKMSASVLTQIKGSRVAFATFGYDLESNLGFTDDLQVVLSYLNTQVTIGETNYSAGLGQARDFIKNRKDKSRDPMVIFFTDGYPNHGNVDSNGIYGGAEAAAIKALGCSIASAYLGDLSSAGKAQLDAISTTPDMVYSANDESKLIDAFTSAFYSAAHPNEISISIDTARFTTSATTASGGEYGDSIVTIEDNVITWDVSKLKASTPYYITIPLQLVANPESGGPRGASETYPTSLEGNSITRVMDMARGNEVLNEVETPILSASQEEASYIRYYNGSTLLQESIIYDGATTHKLTEAPITSAEAGVNVEDGLPVKDGYLFAGWYTTDLTVGTTNGTAFEKTITIADYDDADGNLNLYAAWVPVGTVTKDGKDKNSYGGSSLKGFSLEGVQIRSKEVADKFTSDYNTDQDALRFVTVYRNGMLEELQGLNGKSVSYGYTAYAKTDIANLTKLNKKTTGAVDIDCTKEGDQNHRMFDDYRLSTLVIKYDGADSAYKGDLVEARAYVDYTDANGFGRRGYHTYSDSKFAGGCRTSFDSAWSAVSQAYDALAKVA